MQFLPVVNLEGQDLSKGYEKWLNDFLTKFSKEKLSSVEEYIKDFPKEEGHAVTSKEEAMYWIARLFVDYCVHHESPQHPDQLKLWNAPPDTKQPRQPE